MVPNKWSAMQVLDCYRQACLCADHGAYRHMVISDLFRQRGTFGVRDTHDPQADRWLSPCRLIKESYRHFDAHHTPAS